MTARGIVASMPLLAALFAGVLAGACAGGAADRGANRSAGSSASVAVGSAIESTAPSASATSAGASRSSGADHPLNARGITLTRWFVPIDPAARAAGIARALDAGLLAAAEPIDAGSAMGAAGFSLYTADAARLDELVETLGGSPQVRSVLLGTLADWADTESVHIEPGRAIFFGGRPRMPGDTNIRLWLRGWCLPTVDAARARIEARVTTEDTRVDRITLDPTLAARPRARVLEGERSAFELEPGRALVILEKPIVPPERAANDPLAVLPPPTIAALLLAERAIPGRATILVVSAAMEDMLPTSVSADETP